MKNKIELLGILFCIPLVLSFAQDKVLKKVTFLPLWVPQPQFAGYYMAKEKGIYEKYGLDVTIKPGGHNEDVPSSLNNGEADFGILFLSTGVMERAKNDMIVNIGQIFQRSGIMFVTKKSSGIKSLKDFNGKKIGVWRTVLRELTSGFLRKHNIHAEVIQFDKGVNVFLKGVVDITVMMNYNEYNRLINSGVNPDEINVFNYYDYEMNFPEDGIYCTDSTYKNDPEMCRKFVEASIEGWNYALANKEETITIMSRHLEKSKIPANRSHSLWMLNSMKDMLESSNKNVKQGTLLENDFNSLVQFLLENRFINTAPLFNDFYRGSR